jgi:hypothetical protein
MKTENDFTKNDFEVGADKKFKWGYVIAFVIIAAIVVVFAPFKKERVYADSTEIRLIDLVLVNVEWKAEYKTPLLVVNYNEDRQRFERNVEAVVGNHLNRIIRTCIDSKQLLIAGKDSMQTALYVSEKVRELPVDTVIITELRFEQRFLDYLAEQTMLRQRAITDSIAHSLEMKRANAELERAKIDKKIRELEK